MTAQQYNINIKVYDGDLALINKILDLINNKYSELFHSVFVHGSVATNEVIAYSDFDGLLIVRDNFINSVELKKFKNDSMKLILEFDPLQHHGWFQIKESDLKDYPENYLPVSTLEHAKLIYPNKRELNLQVEMSEIVDYKSSLKGILNQFENRIKNNWRPKNVYELKSILSQIMLIPCLYYSAIYNKGIFKRESFKEVKGNFNNDEWYPIEIASEIRSNWTNNFNPLHSFLLKLSDPFFRKFVKKYAAPQINAKVENKLDSKFYSNLNKLINKIKKDIQ